MRKPLLIYDGDCAFCKRWVTRWRRLTGEHVDYAPFQEVASQFPHVPPQHFEKAVHLIEPDGSVTSGAEAVFRTLAYGGKTVPLWFYRHLPGFHGVSERVYRWVAEHRAHGSCPLPRTP